MGWLLWILLGIIAGAASVSAKQSDAPQNFVIDVRLVSRTRLLADNCFIQGLTFGYDLFGRQSSITDARNGTTTFSFGPGDLGTPKPATTLFPEEPGTMFASRIVVSYCYNQANQRTHARVFHNGPPGITDVFPIGP